MSLKTLFSARDVTVGTPWKRILELAIPMLIGNIAQQLYNTVDTIVVGKYIGDDALSAVGASGPILMMVFVLFMGVATGAGILVSQRFGAKDREGLSRVIGNVITLTLIASILTSLIGLVLTRVPLFGGRTLLGVMNTPEGDIYNWSQQYLTVLFLGITGSIYYNIFSGILRGIGDSVSALVFLLVSTILNIFLDIYFVASLGLGVFGVALATIISQIVSSVLCVIKLFKMRHLFDMGVKYLKLDKDVTKGIISLGVPSGISQAIFAMSSILVQSLTNSMGPMVMACNVVVMRVDSFAMMPSFSIGAAMTTFAGQNFGARRYERLRLGSKQCMIIALITSTVLTAGILVFGRGLAYFFTETDAIVDLACKMLRILAFGYICMGVSQTLYAFMRGVGDTKTPMWIGIFTQVILRLPIAYLIVRNSADEAFPNGRPEGLFLSMLISWVLGMIIAFIFQRRSLNIIEASAGADAVVSEA